MAYLPAQPDLDQLRHQARDLLRAAQRGHPDAVARINAVSGRLILSSAQLALAREYGFASWAKLKLEVERRDILNSRDLSRLARLLGEHPELATTKVEHWCDHKSADPVGYMAMLRFDHGRLGLPSELPGTGAAVKALIDAGAAVDGYPGDKETPADYRGKLRRRRDRQGADRRRSRHRCGLCTRFWRCPQRHRGGPCGGVRHDRGPRRPGSRRGQDPQPGDGRRSRRYYRLAAGPVHPPEPDQGAGLRC